MSLAKDFFASNGVVQDHLAVHNRIVARQIIANEIIAGTITGESSGQGVAGATGATGASGPAGPSGGGSVPGAIADDIATFTASGDIQDAKGGSLTSAGVLNLSGTGGGLLQFSGIPVLQEDASKTSVAVGSSAGLGGDGNFVTSLGIAAAANTTAGSTTAVGYHAAQSNTSGNSNTAVGSQCLRQNTTGANCTAVGFQALAGNTTSSGSTAVGSNAGAKSTAALNTFVGQSSGFSVLTGANNTCVGGNSGQGLSTGDRNVFVGSLTSASGGGADSQNVVIGHQAQLPVGPVLRSVVIGQGASSTANDNVVIGQAATSTVDSTVVGQGASCTHANCILLGAGATSGATNEIVLGQGMTTVGLGSPGPASFIQVRINNAQWFIPVYQPL